MNTTHTTLFKRSLLASSIALALAACGGGSSSGTTEAESGAAAAGTASLSGTVADGYLVGAQVCLDLNNNKVCDEGEPSTTSSEGGVFTLDGVTQEQIDNNPLLVKIIANETVDEDNPGVAIDKAYSMTAPAGYSFVSPLTTMVQQEIEANEGNDDFSLEDAEVSVQTKLGTTLKLSDDYVEGKGTDSSFTDEQKEEFERLHKVAQVTARVLKDNIDLIENKINNSNLDITFEQILDLVVAQVLESLEIINTEVDGAIEAGGTFDPDALASSDEITSETTIDTATVEEQVAVREAEKSAEQLGAEGLYQLVSTEGVNWLEADRDNNQLMFFYGNFKYNAETGASSETEYYYSPTSGEFVLDTEEYNDSNYLLAANGWQLVTENENIELTTDGKIKITYVDAPEFGELLEATAFNVSGTNIAAALALSSESDEWADVVDENATFGADGRLAYKLKFTSLQDTYEMWNWDGCEAQQIVGGMCNSIWVNSGDGNGENDGSAVALLDLISATASNATDPSQIKGPQVAWFDVENGNGSVTAEMVSGGSVNYYRTVYTYNSTASTEADIYTDGTEANTATAEKIATGTWVEKTVNGVKMYIMELPTNVVGLSEHHDADDRFTLFTEFQGYVRIGGFFPQGDTDGGEVVFDKFAMEDIVASFSSVNYNELVTSSSTGTN